MADERGFDHLVAPLRDDVTSGASHLAAAAAEVLSEAAARLPAASVDELRSSLGSLCLLVLDAQPSSTRSARRGSRWRRGGRGFPY